ncbi:sensor histidine kinase [Paenibacillus harenae]|uniref:histidine kinase n=1 Tax=Paenibacillus harenae TaxID=306543 RepID=A0ABT9U797_PAEHA|nr:sensor histidine kinase [Paenibacillus harenae]MDQ0114099.1 signal transduction histidine kinase [Paenibacillus harenae]
MNYIVKTIIFGFLIIELILGGDIPYEQLLIVMIAIVLQLVKERYFDSIWLTIAMLLLTCAGVAMDFHFSIWFAIVFYDFMLKKGWTGPLAVLVCVVFFLTHVPQFYWLVVFISLSGMLAYQIRRKREEASRFTLTLDNERRLRYELEQAKAQLLHASKEIAGITEVKERNRIAREIHDSVGHNLTGIFIQLQAAQKIHDKDENRAMSIVKTSINGLANTIELLRDTVHNIKPRESLGADYFQGIIENYQFCPVDLQLSGDFNSVPSAHLELLSATIKEALTNTARYSQATKVEIKIDVNMNYTRLSVKDNGIGSANIKEGLGLSGMKERTRNLGGSFSFRSLDGFMIVCVIPRQKGGEMFEGTYRG